MFRCPVVYCLTPNLKILDVVMRLSVVVAVVIVNQELILKGLDVVMRHLPFMIHALVCGCYH